MGLLDMFRRTSATTEPGGGTTPSAEPSAAPAASADPDTRRTDPMRITIIGAGNMARGIATRALAGGHAVQIVARDTAEADSLAADLAGDVTTGPVGDDLTGDVVVLALPYDAALAVANERRDALDGKVVVDITNPVDFATFDSLVTPAGSSAAEEIAKVLPGSAVVKAFNTTFAGTLTAGEVAGEELDVLVASDDADAKAAVIALADSPGMRGIDAGSLKRAQQLEALGFLHMTLQGSLGNTWSTGVKFLGA